MESVLADNARFLELSKEHNVSDVLINSKYTIASAKIKLRLSEECL